MQKLRSCIHDRFGGIIQPSQMDRVSSVIQRQESFVFLVFYYGLYGVLYDSCIIAASMYFSFYVLYLSDDSIFEAHLLEYIQHSQRTYAILPGDIKDVKRNLLGRTHLPKFLHFHVGLGRISTGSLSFTSLGKKINLRAVRQNSTDRFVYTNFLLGFYAITLKQSLTLMADRP